MEVMADRAVEIMNDPERRERMRGDMAAYVRDVISWERVAARYDAIYNEALQCARTHSAARRRSALT